MSDAAVLNESRNSPPSRGAVAIISGVLGEILITLGVLCGLFAVWQIFWTDVVAGDLQQKTINSVVREWDASAAEPLPTTAAPRGEYGDPPVLDRDSLNPSQVYGIMWIPRFGENGIPLAEGTDTKTVLDEGEAGHYPDTAMPGEVGNFATAAHRSSYAKPYHLIADLQEGDPIVVETKDAYYVYKYTSYEIVSPADTAVLLPVPRQPEATATDRLLTLTACHPMYSLRERYIAYGKFDYWVPRSAGIPAEILTTTNVAAAAQGAN
ncbi:class E sortase [Micrococcales bacterium 31B]|nr:class E sortase [Micrococcales bacterium 31B]